MQLHSFAGTFAIDNQTEKLINAYRYQFNKEQQHL